MLKWRELRNRLLSGKTAKIRVAGKQGFVTPCFSNLFNIKQLRAKLLKTQNFIFSFSLIWCDIFSYFLLWNGHKMVTSLS